MMKRFVVLVLASAVAAPALADDIPEWYAPFRGVLRTTFSDWTYDDPCGVYSFDPPENSWYVSHPDYEDPPPIDPCLPFFSAQTWGYNDDPCASDWYDALPGGHQGGVALGGASWNINNFVTDWPAKDIWVQLTYLSQGGGSADPCIVGAGYIDPSVAPEPWGLWFGPPDPCDPCSPGDCSGPLADWDCPGPPMETWMESSEEFVDAEMVNRQTLENGWIHEVWAVTFPISPDSEWIEFGYPDGMGILLDQIVIETFPFPEPATMVLLGLGGLLMIRRRR